MKPADYLETSQTRGNQSIVSMAGYNKTCISQNLVKLQTNSRNCSSHVKQSVNDQVREQPRYQPTSGGLNEGYCEV